MRPFLNPILYFPIAHNTLCLPPQILHKPLFLNAPGSIVFSQEHFKTISYAKFGGQTECIMGNWKIVNSTTKFTTTTSVDWEKTGTTTSVSAGKRKVKMRSVGRSTTTTLNVSTDVKL